MTEELHQQAAAFVLGALNEEERSVFEVHLQQCPECLPEVWQFEDCLISLASACAERPAPELRDRLLAETVRSPEGIRAVRADEATWNPTPYPGVTVKPLYQHPVTQQWTQLFQLSPGSTFPRHLHTGDEQCLVLAGEVRFGGELFRSGDFMVAQAGSIHEVVSTTSGCTLLIVSSPTDQVLA